MTQSKAMTTVSEPSVPAVYALHLAQGVRLAGGSDAQLLAELGIPYDELAQPDARISFERIAHLIERALALSNEPALGPLLGWHSSLSKFGMLGFAALSAPNLGAALQVAVRFSPLLTSICRFQLQVAGDTATLELEELHSFGALREFFASTILVTVAKLGETLAGQPLFPQGRVEFAFPAPVYVERIDPALQTLLHYDQPQHRLVFARALLDMPVATADPAAHRTALEVCERQLADYTPGASLVQRVTRALLAADGAPVHGPAEIARGLGMAERTLKRKLAEHGTSYSQLLDRERQTRALALLRTAASIEEVAARLGYSDAANFTRAFRRWTGQTPRALRRR